MQEPAAAFVTMFSTSPAQTCPICRRRSAVEPGELPNDDFGPSYGRPPDMAGGPGRDERRGVDAILGRRGEPCASSEGLWTVSR